MERLTDDRAAALAAKLEELTEVSIDRLRAVLALPLDVDNGALLRAVTAAASIGLNAQLRADAMRLRALRDDRALAALLALIADKERVVPSCESSAGRVVDAGTVSADLVPYVA